MFCGDQSPLGTVLPGLDSKRKKRYFTGSAGVAALDKSRALVPVGKGLAVGLMHGRPRWNVTSAAATIAYCDSR